MLKNLLFCATIATILLTTQANAQTSDELKRADVAFNAGEYEKALPTYLSAHKSTPTDAMLNYKIGVAYFRTPDAEAQSKALNYLEASLSKVTDKVPFRLYYYLGKCYHLGYQFDKAQANFEKYKSKVNKDDKLFIDTQRSLVIVSNAKKIVRDTVDVLIQNLGKDINTPNTEYGSVISADENLMIYTLTKKDKSGQYVEQLFTARKKNYSWKEKQQISFKTSSNVGSVGLSADGQELILYMGGENGKGGLFMSKQQAGQWAEPVKFPAPINSGNMESAASMTTDESVMYFASNRAGGAGGRDIYRVEKQPDGSWGKPENLKEINTPFDEDAPFIHPDRKTLYFTSNGHNTIGGDDIFKTTIDGLKCSAPKNMGYPINSVYNDSYFALSANGTKGYFSSDRLGGQGMQDIYFLGIPEENGIPLTMIKGKILAGNPPKAIPTKIRVIDKTTNKPLKHVYNPNAKTGDYLMIFPPGKNYDMLIEAEGYLPYLVNINIPNQTYFYEMYQEITLQKKMVDNKEVGQDIVIKQDFKAPQEEDATNFQGRNLDLYDLMEDIAESEDTVARNYLLDIMYNEESIDAQENSTKEEAAVQATFFYDDASGNLVEMNVDGKKVKTLKAIDTKNPQNNDDEYSINKGNIVLNKTYTAFYPSKEVVLDTRAKVEVLKFADYLKKNPTAGMQIIGYASSEGDTDANMKLSEQRAKAAYDYFVLNGVEATRITYKGAGSKKSADPEAARRKMRRADIKIMPIADLKK